AYLRDWWRDLLLRCPTVVAGLSRIASAAVFSCADQPSNLPARSGVPTSIHRPGEKEEKPGFGAAILLHSAFRTEKRAQSGGCLGREGRAAAPRFAMIHKKKQALPRER